MVLPILQKVGRAPLDAAQRGRGGGRQAAQGLRRRGPVRPRVHRRARRRPTASASELTDEYLSTEHLLLALADRLRRRPARSSWPPCREVRGSHRVTSQNPEDQYQALEKYGRDLTEAARAGQDRPRHRARRRDPPRHPGAVPAHQEQPGAHRRARRRQDRDRRGPGPPHRRGRRAREPEEQAAHRARPGQHGGRRQVPRRVRGAAQGRAQGDHRRRGRGHHLHRRDAHHRRRRRGRGGHGRRQHDQAACSPAASCA